MRLTVIIESLGRGGAERTASLLASAWARQGHDVTFITLKKDDVPCFPLHNSIRLCQLQVRGGISRNFLHGIIRQTGTVRAVRRALREIRPDVVISFMDIPNVLTLLATRSLPTRTVITEHNHPAYYRIGWVWETLRRLVYRRADLLVCVSQPLADWFSRETKVVSRVIPNPIDLPASGALSPQREYGTGGVIVGMGRLVSQKGFDLLIEAFSRIAQRHPNWSLKIVGDGVLREPLRKQCATLGLDSRVEFTGAVSDPAAILLGADLFVFSSRYEGFGNALCEAMACGLPAISFDCPSGPSEIIRHGIDGLLVPPEDVTSLSRNMDELMSNVQERKRLAERAPEVMERFGFERVLPMWNKLFAELALPHSQNELQAGSKGQ